MIFTFLTLLYAMLSLPQSTSGFMQLDGIDLLKILRLLGVTFLGAFCASITSAGDITADPAAAIHAAALAGAMALSSAAIEAIRRFFTTNQ